MRRSAAAASCSAPACIRSPSCPVWSTPGAEPVISSCSRRCPSPPLHRLPCSSPAQPRASRGASPQASQPVYLPVPTSVHSRRDGPIRCMEGTMFASINRTPFSLPRRFLLLVALGVVGLAAPGSALHAQAPSGTRFAGPTSSQPLALTADDAFLVVANPDNNSVTFFDVRAGRNRKLLEVPVQKEPWGVAFLPNGSKAYVANTVSGTVSMLRTNLRNGVIQKPVHIKVGTEPYALALTPNGTRLYVANARSNDVSVIDTASDTVVETIANVGFEPRGLAITNDGDGDDADEVVYVTQFLSLPLLGKVDGADDAKAGFVSVVSTTTNSVVKQIQLNPIADTGFKALGDALARIPPGDPADPANFKFVTGAYPNQLNNVAIKGSFAYVPNTGASPNGPVRFDVNTHSLLHVIDRVLDVDANKTLNMHTAVRDQTAQPKRFLTMPWAIAFKHGANEGYVVTASSDVLFKLTVNPADGSAAVQFDPSQLPGARVLEIAVGKSPRGIVIN